MHTGIRLIAVLAGGWLACTPAPPRASEGARDSVRVQAPGPGDSLAKLLRRQLTDPDPVSLQQAVQCEHMRLGRLLGEKKATLVALRVQDTIYTERDREALRRVASTLGGHVFTTKCNNPPDTQPRNDSAGPDRAGTSSARP